MPKISVMSCFTIQTQSNPLSKDFWKSAAAEFKNLRTLTTVALLIAVSVVISSFFVPVGENLKIFFSFLPKALYCAVGGPFVGLAAGFVDDVVGYLLHPTGGFFFGYTLSTMVGNFLYALCFYRTKITLPRIIVAKVSVNYLVNLLMGCLWSQMLYGKGYLYYLAKSALKNTIMLPIEILLLWLLFLAMRKVAQRIK